MKLRAVFCLIMAMIFMSCTKEEVAEVSLEGKWSLISYTFKGNAVTSESIPVFDFVGNTKDENYEIEFFDDPKTYATTGGYTMEATTNFSETVEDGVVVLEAFTDVAESTITDYETTGTWSINEDILTGLSFVDGQFDNPNAEFEIINLTSNSLELYYNRTSPMTNQGEFHIGEFHIEGPLIFEKQ